MMILFKRMSKVRNNQNGDDPRSGERLGRSSPAGASEQSASDNAMVLFPVKPESCLDVGEWMDKCKAAGILFPLPLAHACSQIEKELGLKWPDSFYLLRQNHFVEFLLPNLLMVRLDWNKLFENKRPR